MMLKSNIVYKVTKQFFLSNKIHLSHHRGVGRQREVQYMNQTRLHRIIFNNPSLNTANLRRRIVEVKCGYQFCTRESLIIVEVRNDFIMLVQMYTWSDQNGADSAKTAERLSREGCTWKLSRRRPVYCHLHSKNNI